MDTYVFKTDFNLLVILKRYNNAILLGGHTTVIDM